jgi:5-methylcytosine-specific restriction protein A
MPIINLPNKNRIDKKNNDNHKYIYNTKRWREVRKRYLMNNPLCKLCLEKGIFKKVDEVHHIKPLSTASDVNEKIRLGFDLNNLMGLCRECHIDIHKNNSNKND